MGPYEIVASIGAGGMGQVFKARDTRLDRTVAIKVLSPIFAADPGLRPQDVFINLLETAKENWSFGNGVAQYA